MAPAMLGDCKNSVTAIVDQSEGGNPDGLAQTTAREWQACLSANAPADVAAAVSAAVGCGAAPPPAPAGGGHRRAQDIIDAVLALLTAFVLGDGSVCAMVAALAAPQSPPAPPPCEDDQAWRASAGRHRLTCVSLVGNPDYCTEPDAAGVSAADACPIACQSGCYLALLAFDDCCASLPPCVISGILFAV